MLSLQSDASSGFMYVTHRHRCSLSLSLHLISTVCETIVIVSETIVIVFEIILIVSETILVISK